MQRSRQALGDLQFPVKHRSSRPGYDWPIRWEHERAGPDPAFVLRTEPEGVSALRASIRGKE